MTLRGCLYEKNCSGFSPATSSPPLANAFLVQNGFTVSNPFPRLTLKVAYCIAILQILHFKNFPKNTVLTV